MKIIKILFDFLILISSIFSGMIAICLIELIILQIMIAVDPDSFATGCTYTGKIFNLFYTVSAGEGYMPYQSDFSKYLGAFIGLIIGGLLIYRRYKAIEKV